MTFTVDFRESDSNMAVDFGSVQLVPEGGGGTNDHNALLNRNKPNQHSIDSITGLREALNGIPTDEHISGLIDGAMEELPSVDLTNYYTKTETDKAIEDAIATALGVIENGTY